MQAVILAGGAGTRLRPLTLNVPKAMVDVNGKPFVLYLVEMLKTFGIKDFVFCLGYLPNIFVDYFGDGSKYGVKIIYSIETEFMGTGGALKLAEDHLEEEFIVINGDTYLPFDYTNVYNAFKKAGKTGIVVLYDNNEKVAESNISIDADGNILDYIKREVLKRGDREVNRKQSGSIENCKYVDAGYSIFNKRLLSLVKEGEFVTLETDIFPDLIKATQLTGFVTSQRYYDLGTPKRLELIRSVLK